MPIFSQLMFQALHWGCTARAARRGEFFWRCKEAGSPAHWIRGETHAYWSLRTQGDVFVARNYTPRGIKGEIDLFGCDGKTLAFVEVRTRTVRKSLPALPELSVTNEKTTPGRSYRAAISSGASRRRVSLPV